MKTCPPRIEILEARIAPAVAVFSLASVDGNNGFSINGVAVRDFSGIAVSDAGDVNGDGFDDLLIGASGADPNGGSSGASYVVFGKAGGFAASMDLATLDGTNGFKLSGVAGLDYSGGAVSAAGDVNGDGFGDLLIGAPESSAGGTNSGAGYVVFGKATGFTANLNLSSLNGSNGFRLVGTPGGGNAGISVGAAGDVNGDGFDDVIIGAWNADPNGFSSGASYVVFGKASGFTSSVALSALNGSNGFTINGVEANDLSGRSVSGAGDINNDGFADLIIGAPQAKVAGMENGAGYVVFGKATGFGASINLSTLNGTNGFKLSGVASLDETGTSVSTAGDVNGDGIDDLIIGAPGSDTNGSYSGASYVVFGKTSGFTANLNLSTLNGSNGFKISGPAASKSAFSVSTAGDFDGDGFDDLIIGTGATYSSTVGKSYVVFGKASGFQANLNLSTLNGSNGMELTGAVLDDRSGRAVSAAGDVNGDGFDDLIIGAYSADLNGMNSGSSYVVFGSGNGLLPSISISDVTLVEPPSGTATATFSVTLSSPSPKPVTVQYSTANGTATSPDDYTAATLSTLTFAPGETSKTFGIQIHANSPVEPDETFLVNLVSPVNATLGDAQGIGTIADKSAPFQLSGLLGSNGFKIDGQSLGDRAGASVSDAGDVNGDGFDDVIVGAPGADPQGANSGASYVVFGKAEGFSANFNLGTINGINGFKLSGVAAEDRSGSSVSAAGDINGDGFDDLIVGAPGADPNGYASGASYVLFGKASGFTANVNLSVLNGSNGFAINGEELGRSGLSVSGAGDVNGDGFDDLIVGAPLVDPNGPSSGASYLVFGKATGFAPALNLATLDGINGYKISGAVRDDLSGRTVSAAGDVNGDGFDDVIIGAWLANAGAFDSGASYVVFGRASGFLANLNLSTLDGQNGFRLSGFAGEDHAGYSVSGAGDINGDGFDDVIMGAQKADPSGFESGASYVVFGKAGGFPADLNVSALDGSNGFKLSGVAINDRSGHSVSGAGDFNGDGFDDVIIGAYQATPNGTKSGSSYVVFGKANGFAANLNLSTLNGSNGIRLDGVRQFTYSGISVSAAGDMNGDGFDDVIIGASDNNGVNAGTSYVVFGRGVEVRISDATVNEGNAGGTALQFEVSLSEPAEIPVTVNVATGNGTAEPGSDFAPLGSMTLTFAPGETTKTVSINATGDSLFEADETFSVLLSDAKGAVIRDGTGIGTIRNDDVPPVVSITGGPLLEGNSGTSSVVFTVSLSAPSGLPATVKFETADGTALAGTDYTALTGTLTFAPGETTKTVTVDVLGDVEVEDHESFSVLLSEPNGATINAGTAQGTILNEDGALSITGFSVKEGDSGSIPLEFVVSLEKPVALPVTVNVATADGTAEPGNDFAPLDSMMLTFAPGETAKTVSINATGDSLFEADETFSVLLSDANGAVIRDGTGIGTIRNDDVPPVVSITGGPLLEGNSGTSSLVFTVSLSAPSGLPATVKFETADGTAIAGTDYTALTGTLTFAPGETTKTVTIDVLGDVEVEDHESFSVLLSEPNGATINAGTAQGTILNEDGALSITGFSVREGDTGSTPLEFVVSLGKPSAIPVTVNFATADGTATAGLDYEAAALTQLTFAPGETTKTVTILASGENEIEAHETFSVVLSDASGATILTTSAVGTILNDDTAIRIRDAAAVLEGNEGSTSAIFSVSLERPSVVPVTVRYSTSDGSASNLTDYVVPAEGAEITFAPGETTKTIVIGVLGDTNVETHETFSVLLSAPTGASIAEGVAIGTILNEDTLLRIGDGSVLEGHTGTRTITFTVDLSAESALPVSVNFASADGTATSGVDYNALMPGRLDFAPGETSKTIIVEVLGDIDAEAGEGFSVVLSNGVNAAIEDDLGEGTILDDDVILLGKRKATFTDVDGDIVTIKVSKGVLKVESFTLFPSGLGSQLALVDFSGDSQFSAANLSISAKRAPDTVKGARAVDVGYINAGGIDLGKVTIKGDLGRIDVGDEDDRKPALQSLSANSVGMRGVTSQLPGGSLLSDIAGKLNTFKLADSLADAVISVSDDIGSIMIKGSVIGGSIQSDGRIGALQISGDLTESATRAALITAQGVLAPKSDSKALAIGSISIGGSVDGAQILAGYDRSGIATNADASIGAVTVGGEWIASDLAAGAAAGDDGLFGTDDDARISGGTPIIARIASIVIKGSVVGTQGGTDHFGFVAEQVAAFKAAGTKLALLPKPGNDLTGYLVGTSEDVRVREVV